MGGGGGGAGGRDMGTRGIVSVTRYDGFMEPDPCSSLLQAHVRSSRMPRPQTDHMQAQFEATRFVIVL